MHRLVDAIQVGTHIICLYKEVDKKYTGYNLKILELLDCAFIGVCAVIRLTMVIITTGQEPNEEIFSDVFLIFYKRMKC